MTRPVMLTQQCAVTDAPDPAPPSDPVLDRISDPLARELYRLKIERGMETEHFTTARPRVVT